MFLYLSQLFVNNLSVLGRFSFFVATSFYSITWVKHPLGKIYQQLFVIGVKSLPVIILSGLFTGMVLGLQGQYTLSRFAAEGLLGSAVGLSIVRELGPVLTAIMVVGQAGSSMTSEIGSMRNSEQVDALKMMSISPMGFLVAPRVFASLICFPILTAIFDLIGIFGGYLTGVSLLGSDAGSFWYSVDYSIGLIDVGQGFMKSLFFGLLVSCICCFYGFMVNERKGFFGSKGVSKATTEAVVCSCVCIFIADYLVTSFFLKI